MVAVDTNVLVRIFIDDEKQMPQVSAARNLAKKYSNLYVPQVVQIELVWVLDFSYKIHKKEIIDVLNHLYENDAFTLQHEKQFIEALELYENHNASFADCIIYFQAKNAGFNIVTFDKKFAKLPSVKLLRMNATHV